MAKDYIKDLTTDMQKQVATALVEYMELQECSRNDLNTVAKVLNLFNINIEMRVDDALEAITAAIKQRTSNALPA